MRPNNVSLQQKRKIKLSITLQKMTLNSISPCSIRSTIELDSKNIHGVIHQSKTNTIYMEQCLQIEGQAKYNMGKESFQDKEIQISFQFICQNGESFIGKTSFNINGNQPMIIYEQSQYLQKCVPKKLKIFYNYRIENIQPINIRKKGYLSPQKTIYRSNNVHQKVINPSLASIYLSSSPSLKNSQDILQSYRERILDKKKQNTSINQIRSFKSLGHTNNQEQKREKQKKLQDIVEKKSSFMTGNRQILKNNKSLTKMNSATLIRLQDRQEKCLIQKMPKKGVSFTDIINDSCQNTVKKSLPSQDTQNLKKISKNNFQNEEQQENNKNENQYKLKVKEYQKKIKQTQKKLVKMEQQNQKYIYKLNNYDVTISDLQNEQIRKTEMIKKLQKINNELNDQLDENSVLLKSRQAHYQLKQNNYRQQLNRLQQKIKQSENHRIETMQNLGRSLIQIQENERRYQYTLKQKQKLFGDDRSKLLKKIQDLTNTNTQITKQMNEELKEMHEYKTKYHELIFNLQFSQNTIESKDKQIYSLRERLIKLQNQYSNQQMQIQNLKDLEGQKIKTKRILSQINLKFAASEDKNAKNQNIITQMKDKQTYYMNLIEKLSKEKENTQQSYLNIKKQYTIKCDQLQQLKLVTNKQQNTINTLKVKLQNTNQKFYSQKRCYEQNSNNYKKRIDEISIQLAKKVTNISNAGEQITNLISFNTELTYLLKRHDEQIQYLKKQNQEKQQRICEIMDDYNRVTLQLQQNHIQFDSIYIKLQELQQENYCLKVKLSESQKQSLSLKNQYEINEQYLSTSKSSSNKEILQLTSQLKAKNEQIKQKIKQISILKQNIQESDDEATRQRERRKKTELQMQFLKQSWKSSNNQLQQYYLVKNTALIKENQYLKRQQILLQQLQEKEYSLNQQKLHFTKLQELMKEFKCNIISDIQLLFDQLSKQERQNYLSIFTQKYSLKYYPSFYKNIPQISKSISKFIESLKQPLQQAKKKYKEQIQKREIQLFECEKLRLNYQQQKINYEDSIDNLKKDNNRLQMQIGQLIASKKYDQEKYEQQFDQIRKQIKELQSNIKDKKIQLDQKQYYIIRLQESIQNLTRQNYQQQNIIDGLKKHPLYQTKSTLNQQNVTQLQLFEKLSFYQTVIHEKQTNLYNLSKKLESKQAQIRNNQITLNQIKLQLQKRKQQLKQEQISKDSSITSIITLQQKLKLQINENNQLINQTKQLQNRLLIFNNERYKYQEKYNKQNQFIIMLQRQIQSLKQKINFGQRQILQLQMKSKQKIEISKNQQQKLNGQLIGLRNSIIGLNSQIQIQMFINNQLQINLEAQKSQKMNVISEQQKLKQSNQHLKYTIAIKDQKYHQLHYNFQIVNNQNQKLHEKIAALSSVESKCKQYQKVQRQQRNLIKLKEQQTVKLIQINKQSQQFYQRQLSQLKLLIRQVKKTQSQRVIRQQQFKSRVKILQKLLEQNHPELSLQSKKLRQQYERQKKELMMKNVTLQQQNLRLSQQISDQKTTQKPIKLLDKFKDHQQQINLKRKQLQSYYDSLYSLQNTSK